MSGRTRRGRLGIAMIAAAVLVVVGCSEGGSNGGGAGATPAPGVSAQPGTGGAGEASVTDYLAYTMGEAGPADQSLEPVYIGWLNQEGGQEQIGPLATAGAQTAIDYINAELGGVNGHPVELRTCFIRSAEEEGTTCGQQFAADDSVSVINTGGVAIGIQSFYSTIGGAKPVITGVAATPVDSVQENAVILFGDVTHVLGPFGTYATEVLNAQTAALVYPNISGITEGATAIDESLRSAGVEVNRVGYSANQTDLIGPLTSAGAQNADMVIPYSNAAGCVNLARGLRQLGITDASRIVSAPLCLNSQVSEGLGGDFPRWTYAIASSLFGDESDPGIPPYREAVEAHGDMANAPDPWHIVGFSQILTTVRFMNEIGYDNLNPDALLQTAKSFTGPVALGAPELNCGEYPDAPAVCNDRAQFFLYEGNNSFVKQTNWLQPPS